VEIPSHALAPACVAALAALNSLVSAVTVLGSFHSNPKPVPEVVVY
jgi:hypothetical protein